MDAREQRLMENEEVFRTANNRLEQHTAGLAEPGVKVAFICECVDRDCVERVELTLGEYEGIRSDDNHFLIAPGHPMLEQERLISQDERVWIVAKPAER